MTRASRSSLFSSPLVATTVAALAMWGCGSSGPAGSGGGGHGGGGGRGGNAGSTATGHGGTGMAGSSGGGVAGAAGGDTAGGSGGDVAGSSGGGTAGAAGGSQGGDTGTAGAGAGDTGSSGSSGGANAGSTGTGTAGSTGGSSAGGSGGSGPACVDGAACALTGTAKGICANGTCQACTSAAASACATVYGPGYICGGGSCVMGTCSTSNACNGKICDSTFNCVSCSGNAQCVTAFGNGYVCQQSSGKCVQGACGSKADCTDGQICDGSSHCVGCGSDPATGDPLCMGAYDSGHICIAGLCKAGTCHDANGCSNGQVCSASSHTCVDCVDDTGCRTSFNSSSYICVAGTPNKCVIGCRGNSDCSDGKACINEVCAACTTDANCAANEICLGGACTPGNCHLATDCSGNQTQVCKTNHCGTCASDGECQSTTTGYGPNHLCQNGQCVTGNCRSTNGQDGPTCAASSLLCDGVTRTCTACNGDASCTDASAYGANHVCLGGQCLPGNCHAGSDCTDGKVCDVTGTHSCVICTSDAQCASATNYGPDHYCQSGACVVGHCRVGSDCGGGQICDSSLNCQACNTNDQCAAGYGPNHVCVGHACISGSCATSADCTGSNQLCDSATHTCVACQNDTACKDDTAYGPVHICLKDSNSQNGKCVAGDCHDTSAECTPDKVCGATVPHVCGGCTSDVMCRNSPTYGSTTICLNPGVSGSCVVGDCHDTSSTCPLGQVCGASAAHTCGSCGTDGQCTNDPRYGAGDICFQGNCSPGNCHATSSDCTGANEGLICANNTCGTCSSDGQCKSDPLYSSSYICHTSDGTDKGKCVSASCSTNSATCGANGADFCCGNLCVPGNCCGDTDCVNNPSFGIGYACIKNTCSRCDSPSGNKYYVDPVNGNDQTATGSGLSAGTATPSCAFKTVTRAMQVLGNFAPPNTKVIVLGVAGQTRGLAAADTLPITLPPNIILSTANGPITITMSKPTAVTDPTGFRLVNAGSGITSDAAAPLTLDGNGHNSGIAIQVAAGTGNSVTLSNVTIQNTGGHGITVSSGILNIGGGVLVTGAGTNTGVNPVPRDGLSITGGAANITVPAGQTQTSFNANTNHGIEVGTLGSVNIAGVPSGAPSSNGTIVANGNAVAGLLIRQTPGGGGAVSSIDGLVAWANQNYGARLYGGSNVKVRNSVFGSNAIDGILVSTAAFTTAGNDLSNIDLGVAGNPGHNWLQTPLGALGTNLTAGLCVAMSNGQGALTLNARGNYFVTTGSDQIDCSASSGTITKAGSCQNHNSIGGGTAATATVVTIDVAGCN